MIIVFRYLSIINLFKFKESFVKFWIILFDCLFICWINWRVIVYLITLQDTLIDNILVITIYLTLNRFILKGLFDILSRYFIRIHGITIAYDTNKKKECKGYCHYGPDPFSIIVIDVATINLLRYMVLSESTLY